MCTYQDCSKQGVMFEGRAEWFRHEKRIHRREWCCNATGHSAFQDKEGFRKHIEEHHQELTSSTQLSSVLDLFERAMESTLASCPLCFAEGSSNLSAKRLEKHLARHMEALALFALPRNNNAGDGDLADSDVAARALSTTDSDSSSRSITKAANIDIAGHGDGTMEEISDIYLQQKARFDNVVQEFCTMSAMELPAVTIYPTEPRDTKVSLDWLERVAQVMIFDGTYKTTYDEFMRNKTDGVEASELILTIYSELLGGSPNASFYDLDKQQDKYKEVLGFVTTLYEVGPRNDAYAARLVALLKDLSNDLQAALQHEVGATTSDPSWYYVKPNVPISDNTMGLLSRALEATKQLTLNIRSLPPLFHSEDRQNSGRRSNEVSDLFQTLSTNLEKFVSLLDDTEIDQSIAHRIEQTCWSKEEKIVELTTILRIEDRLRDAATAEPLVSTVYNLNAAVGDMLSLLLGYTSVDEDALGDDEPYDEISPVLRAIAEHIVSLLFTGRASDY